MKRPNVYDFSDYRSFLKAYADDRKREQQGQGTWTYGVWARQLKLAGTASLTMVLNGDRRPGKSMTARLNRYFRFDSRERRYFEDLIRLEKAEDDSRLKVFLMEELRRNSPRNSFKLLDEDTFEAISKWYFYALRQCVRLGGFKTEVTWIKDRLQYSLTARQITQALDGLEKLGLIRRSGTGADVTDLSVRTSDDVSVEAIKRFHEQTIDMAKQSVRKFTPDERVLQATTLAFDSDDFPRAKKIMKKFIEDMSDLASDGGDSVYQANVQFFPVIKVDRDEEVKR